MGDNRRTPQERLALYSERRGGCLIWTGVTNRDGYGRLRIKGRMVQVHRLAWASAHGPIPDGGVVDHICHNPACFEVSHLRLATRAENQAHRKGANRNSRSGLRNIRELTRGRYQVRVAKAGREYGGIFASLPEARAEAERLRKELFGEFAGTN